MSLKDACQDSVVRTEAFKFHENGDPITGFNRMGQAENCGNINWPYQFSKDLSLLRDPQCPPCR